MALLEVCCGNPESVDAAVLGGARRIELCADLEADGLTPPTAWIRDAKARYPALTVHVLVRPRAGDFVYSQAEADAMAAQVEEALEAGADGIVIGALTPDGDVDLPLMERLVSLVESFNLASELLRSDLCHAANDSHFFPGPGHRVSLTFHRAFDRCRRPFDTLEQIIGGAPAEGSGSFPGAASRPATPRASSPRPAAPKSTPPPRRPSPGKR